MTLFKLPEQEDFFVQANQSTFPIRCYSKLKDVCIFLCQKGKGVIEIDSVEYIIEANTHAILLPGTLIGEVHTNHDFQVFYIYFTHNLFEEITNRLDSSFFRFLQENPTVTLTDERLRPIIRMQNLIEDLYNDKENCFRIQILRNNLQSLLLHIYDKTRRLFLDQHVNGISRQEEVFKAFIQLIHKHCTQHREVLFYAQKLCITSRYLSTIVLNTTGKNAKSIIDKYVILEIKAMLKSTNLSIQEISSELHFPDQSFFGRYFKKHTGMSPIQYRNQF